MSIVLGPGTPVIGLLQFLQSQWTGKVNHGCWAVCLCPSPLWEVGQVDLHNRLIHPPLAFHGAAGIPGCLRHQLAYLSEHEHKLFVHFVQQEP